MISHHLLTYREFPFNPALDTIYLKEDHNDGDRTRLEFCKPPTLKIDNIRSLAISREAFWPGTFSTWMKSLFPRLNELILIVDEDDAEKNDEEYGITVTRKSVQEAILWGMERNPNSWIPVIRVMTETAMAKYVWNKSQAKDPMCSQISQSYLDSGTVP
jgi:hypothetical protein